MYANFPEYTMKRRDRTSRFGADKKKRADIVAHGDDRRAEVYRTDAEFTGVDTTKKHTSNSDRVALAAWVYAQREHGRTGVDIAKELGISKHRVYDLQQSHLIYEAKKKIAKEKETEK